MSQHRRSAAAGPLWLLVLVCRWVDRSLRAAAWCALAVLVVSVSDPGAVIADPAGRLRWVAIAGAMLGALTLLLDRPVPGWLRAWLGSAPGAPTGSEPPSPASDPRRRPDVRAG